MAVNLKVVGEKADPVIFTYDEDDVILYALSIGAGVDELDFVYEKNLKVFPTFSVVPLPPIVLYYLDHLNLNLAAILHTEQKIFLHKPILPKGTIIFRGSGFYVTDYRSEEYRKKSKEESKPADKGKSSDSKEE